MTSSATNSVPAIVTPAAQAAKPGLNWTPVQKEQASGVAARSGLDREAQNRLIESAAEILGSGVDPKSKAGSATGLVVGYVQSGKTLSFTTVIALAKDNGFPLVIVIAGNKDSLLTQSHARLIHDLDVESGEGLPAWRAEKNIRAQDANNENFVRQAIGNWRDDTLDDDERATTLLTVLKQNQRLQSLTTILKRIDLRDVPVLVIDDEADQASLNTKVRQGQESTTYTRLLDLRDALPCHTYLQYTATPQAPLLINIADTLSPSFVKVLEPGTGYVGGSDFFRPGSPYVRTIPFTEITPDDMPQPVDPPATFLTALRLFLVGLSASLILSRTRRSMLIHPSRRRAVHRASVQWAAAALQHWANVLNLDTNDPDRLDLLADLKVAYDDIAATYNQIPSFDDIVGKLPRAIRNTTIIEFNTNGRPRTPEIKWRNAEGWILVGGQAVDRGFTVDSLTVTYMPRGVGMGNADSIQQRARFFGYKRKYLGLCRIFLEADTRQGFEDYVEHEDIMRAELKRIAETGADLKAWRRRFVLSNDLEPCRHTVISDDFYRGSPWGGWTQQRGAEMTAEARDANKATLRKFVNALSFSRDARYASTEVAQQHDVAENVPLQKVVEMLLDYRLGEPRDTASFTGLLVTLGEALKRDSNITVSVYHMRPRAGGARSISDEGTIPTVQQGQTRLRDGSITYPGDAFFKSPRKMSVQLHQYDLKRAGQTVALAAPLLAIHIPRALAQEWLVQLQAGQVSA